MKNEFSTDEFIRLANIVPAAHTPKKLKLFVVRNSQVTGRHG